MSATETNEPIKVAKWNGSKVKIALDDAVRDAVLKRGFVEDFSSTDIKLLATAVAIAVAGFGIYYSQWRTLEASKMVLAVCVTAYFLLTSWVGVHAYYVDRDRLMRAYAEGEHSHVVEIHSSLQHTTPPTYKYSITTHKGAKAMQPVVVEESIGAYIDAEGTVHTAILDSRIDAILGAHAKKRE